MTHLLVNCDLDWVPDMDGFVAELGQTYGQVTILPQAAPLEDADLSGVTHWITNPAPRFRITRALVDRHMPALQAIGSPSTGVTHIDPALAQGGITVKCLQDIPKSELARITASSEFTLLLFLSVIRKGKVIHDADLADWRDDLKIFRGRQVCGMRVLVFGNGRIGSNLARYLTAMGAEVVFYEPDTAKHQPDYQFIAESEIEATLPGVDAVCLCFHWSVENENFFHAGRLEAMRDDAFFINTSRGENLDEGHLCDLIEAGKFAGVGLDVLRNEQSAALKTSRVLALEKVTPRLTVTPHIAGCSVDSERLAFFSIFNLLT